MTKHNYELEVAKDFAAPLLMRYSNKFEGADHTITYEPYALAWYDHTTDDVQIFRNQQSVQGVQTGNSIYYTNAFGNGVDFEITLQRSGFKKEVVIPNKPAVFPTPPTPNHRLVALFKYGGSGLKVLKDTQEEWDGNTYFDSDGGFELAETANPVAKSFIKPAYAVDSSEIPKSTSLRVMWVKRNNQLWQGKEIPLDKMANATFPVRFDTVTSYYAGAGDGVHLVFGESSYSNARTVTSADLTTYTAAQNDNYFQIGYQGATDWRNGRLHLPFDTSGIGSGNTVSAASVFVKGEEHNGTTDIKDVTIVESTASPTTPSDADYNNIGSTEFTNTRQQILADGSVAYMEFALNASGIANVDVTGTSQFAILHEWDIDAATLTSSDYSRYRWFFSERAGDTDDPYIEVTYSGGSSTSIKSINGVAQASIGKVNGVAIASIKSYNGVSNVS
jgi:hypothetical protein